jgi:hypothetical protein
MQGSASEIGILRSTSSICSSLASTVARDMSEIEEDEWTSRRTLILALVTLISFNLLFAMTSYTPALSLVKLTFDVDDFWVSLSV